MTLIKTKITLFIISGLFMMIMLLSCNTEKTTCSSANFNEISESDKEKLRYLKEFEWSKAYREQDVVLLDRILADEFQFIQEDGSYSNKKMELEWIKNNEYKCDSFIFEIKRFEFFENGTAIVSGTGHIYKDSLETTYQSSNVFIMRNSQWKAISSHVSGVK